MPTESTQLIFKCDHCRKVYQRKSFCIIHEYHCFKNPKNKHICTRQYCEHLKVTTEVIAEDDWSSIKGKVFTCKKLGKTMYGYKMDGDSENAQEARERSDMRMPITCEHYKMEEYFSRF